MIKLKNISQSEKLISISTDIGNSWFADGYTLKNLQEDLEDWGGALTIEINSRGGDPIEGLAMYDYLKGLKGKITAFIIGQCSSAATLIACAADTVKATKYSRWLVHRVVGSAEGTSDEIQGALDAVRSLDNQIIEIYISKTGKTESELLTLMNKDTYLTAEEAKEWGFIDEIINYQSNVTNMKKFKNLTEEEQAEMDALLAENEQLKTKIAELEGKIAELENELATYKDKEVEQEVEADIKAGKFDALKKTDLLAVAKKDFRTYKLMAAAVQYTNKRVDINTPFQYSGALTKEQWVENYKSGVYKDNPEKLKLDYELVFGKKWD